jgi:hypothetical protein
VAAAASAGVSTTYQAIRGLRVSIRDVRVLDVLFPNVSRIKNESSYC